MLPGTFVAFATAASAGKQVRDGSPGTAHHFLSEILSESANPEGVSADKCCIAWDEQANRLMVMIQSSGASSVDFKHLAEKDKNLFNASRSLEMENLLNLGAYRILSLEESLEFRRLFP